MVGGKWSQVDVNLVGKGGVPVEQEDHARPRAAAAAAASLSPGG
jgi:hypothetical protein